ncbi:MAG: NTPase [Anaerolineae bacterium]|jgi:nucleoside-triphosphatase
MGRTLLLTGRPGVGKTTVVKKVARALGEQAGGFITEEIRSSSDRRLGFRVVTLSGKEAIMAHVDLRGQGRPRVSRYGVDVMALEAVGVAALRAATGSGRTIIVDEIGKMELFSDAFKDAVLDAIEGECPVLGTVMSGSDPWVDDLKARDRVEVWEVTAENRHGLPQRIRRWLMR